MKKSAAALVLLFFSSVLLVCGQEMPTLKFNEQSKFKIAQFTDIHLQYDSYRSDSVLVMMRAVIEKEKPDLVMLTGDVVGSDNRKRAWLKVAQVMIDAKTPWAAMFGNHDAEFELNKQETMEAIVGLPYNLTVNGPADVAGEGNYVLPIQSSTSNEIAALCYVLDVSATNPPPANSSGVYEWIDDSQVQWYIRQSNEFAQQNGGEHLPALAFFHIPFPEYNQVIGKSTTVGYQVERENVQPQPRSNLFAAMQARKDIMGTFVGHHHNNNYIGNLDGISLAFGQTSGRQVYGELGAGARIIELHEGTNKFDTWILKLYDSSRDRDIWTPTHNTEPMFFVSHPESFVKDRKGPGKINMVTHAGGQVSFRLSGRGTVTVDWGDGSPKSTVSLDDERSVEFAHTFTSTRPHRISIEGSKITEFDCRGMQLTALDVRNNKELEVLDCGDNQLTRLDLSGNEALAELWCDGNQLTNLDLNNNRVLAELYCYKNYLRDLNINNNTALVRLNCSQNQLTDLDLSKNTVLRRVDCYENRLTSLDLSKNKTLIYAVCNDNLLTSGGLDALFATLLNNEQGNLFIAGNPGEELCDRSIATQRGWRVRLRY